MYMNVSEIRDKQAVVVELKEALRKAGLSQAWAADRLGITKAHISRILGNKCEASLELVIRLKELADKVNSLNLEEAI